jgi:diguanylate cyclase (GGDEF)-like protein
MEMDGQDSLVTLSRDKLAGWSIITITPYGNIWYTVHDAVIRGAILGFVIMLFVNLAAHLLATRITRPLEEINEIISNLASGKGDIDQLHIYKDDELEEITTALNEMRHIHEGLIKEAQVDKLTGLHNQYSVEEFCRHKLREYEDAPSPGLIAIMLVDLDHFKKANREEGRLYGDKVLKEFADKLKNLFQDSACIGRLEADEFVVVLDKQKDKETIRAKAQLINETARNITVGEDKVGLTVSIGVAIAPFNGKTYNHLFHAADLALYEVKENGRDSYKLADDLDA